MPRNRPRPHTTTYDLARRRRPLVRMVWPVLAGVLSLVLAFAGIAAVSRAVSPAPAASTSGQTPPAVASPTTAPTPTPTITSPQGQVDAAAIQGVTTRFVDAWLQRDRAKRKTQLTATATKDLAAALMKTADQNIPRTKRAGTAPVIESRTDGVAIVLQQLADSTTLKLTVTNGADGTWRVTSIDMAAG